MLDRLWKGFCKRVLGHHTQQVLGEVNVHLFVRKDFTVTPDGVTVGGVLVTTSSITTLCKWCDTRERIDGFMNSIEISEINIGRNDVNLTLGELLDRFQEAFKADHKEALAEAFSKRDQARIELDTWVATVLAGGPINLHGRECTIVEDDYVHRD